VSHQKARLLNHVVPSALHSSRTAGQTRLRDPKVQPCGRSSTKAPRRSTIGFPQAPPAAARSAHTPPPADPKPAPPPPLRNREKPTETVSIVKYSAEKAGVSAPSPRFSSSSAREPGRRRKRQYAPHTPSPHRAGTGGRESKPKDKEPPEELPDRPTHITGAMGSARATLARVAEVSPPTRRSARVASGGDPFTAAVRRAADGVRTVVRRPGTPYDGSVTLFVAFRRRPITGVGLVVAVGWIVLVAVECFTTHPWDRGGLYANLAQTLSLAGPGIFGVAALVWLVERAVS
jgi:hypothetical protein